MTIQACFTSDISLDELVGIIPNGPAMRELEALRNERDALAAHVKAGKAVIANLLEVHKEELSEWESAKIAEAGEWIAETPQAERAGDE